LRALSSLNLADNCLGLAVGWHPHADHEGWFRGPNGEFENEVPLDMSGVFTLASAIRPVRDMRAEAISSVNLLLNDIGIDQAKGLVDILKAHPTLKTLCGNTGNETELNMSGKMRGAGDAIMLVPDIIDNGALTSINVEKNIIPAAQKREIFQAIGMNKLRAALRDEALTELDVSGIGFGAEGVPLVAKYISGNGVLTSLDISDNKLTRGAYNGSGHPDYDRSYATDTTGMCVFVAMKLFSDAMLLLAGVATLADAIRDNDAMSQFAFSGDYRGHRQHVTMETSMVEADFSGKLLGVFGAIMLSALLPKCT
jgi:hypothetical protein